MTRLVVTSAGGTIVSFMKSKLVLGAQSSKLERVTAYHLKPAPADDSS